MESTSVRVILHGARGRMGRAISSVVPQYPGFQIAAEVDLGDDLATVVEQGDVVVDFSAPSATGHLLDVCVSARKPLVLGTTGHEEEDRRRIREASERIPIVWASNFSTGVNLLFWLVERAAMALGPSYDVEIIEMHHRHKQDAPSGTARTLAEILVRTRQPNRELDLVCGRHGLVGPRRSEEIGIHAVRGGDVVGDHTVIFATFGERLELTHRASSRETFARGALRAARWVLGRPAGLYDMQDVLGLRERA
ncbi:MAG: 4-hydroxy-tetrahydrodipicolinate reductase [Verrucomicrobiota bacterium]|nr:4-hydroxy-tetrahydrodipicolinate reductase [Limisphaera sp.]MDW8383082.1 4-hydroxy-tetrahydrodipicolinate reductase [Verrucomicrobiota bacterium]